MKSVALGLLLIVASAGSAAATCAMAPLPPPREPGCRDMESVCVCYGSNSTDCAWRYYCVPERGPDYYQRSYDRPRSYDPPPRMVPDGIFPAPAPYPAPRFRDTNPFMEGWERTDRMMRQRY